MRWQTRRGERLWKASTPRLRRFFAAAVFFTFAGAAILLDVTESRHVPLGILALYVTLFGFAAIAYSFAGLKDWRLLPIALALQAAATGLGSWAESRGYAVRLSPAGEHERMVTDAIGCFLFIVVGYSLLIRFIHALSQRGARLQTEVQLAKQIHESLVPAIAGRSSGAEYYGRSQASNEIGGDLVDVVVGPEATTLFVADVSGHGVGAGVLMAMLKSAARTVLSDGTSLSALFAHLNRTVCDLERPGTFATCACLQIDAAGTVRYALAGHLPILHQRSSGEVAELAGGGPMLGLDRDGCHDATTVEIAPADRFVLVTDGVTEVFRRARSGGPNSKEFGLEGVRAAMDAFRDGSARDLADTILKGAAAYGGQDDDQTILVVKLGT